MKKDVYLEVTNNIIRMMENGFTDGDKWRRPWRQIAGQSPFPVNVNGRHYRGLNVWLLMGAAIERGYQSNVWATYKMWSEKGGQIRKGEKGTMVILWKPTEYKEKQTDGTEKTKKGMFCKAFTVFNIEQQDGFSFPEEDESETVEHKPHETLIQYLNREGIPLENGGNRAFYRPSADSVHMPPVTSFPKEDDYNRVLAHECIHSTGAKKRLDREFGNRFGSNAYAFEELVAELGSAMFCALNGIQMPDEIEPNHAKYVKHWLEVMKGDKKAIFTAASKAQKAVDLIENAEAKEESAPVKEAA